MPSTAMRTKSTASTMKPQRRRRGITTAEGRARHRENAAIRQWFWVPNGALCAPFGTQNGRKRSAGGFVGCLGEGDALVGDAALGVVDDVDRHLVPGVRPIGMMVELLG